MDNEGAGEVDGVGHNVVQASKKSRSLVLKRGKVVDKFQFCISETPIPTLSEKPVKSLGKIFDSSLRDTASIKSTYEELEG